MEAPRKQKIYKICLTGGPCAGKTTALTQLKDHITEKGFKVFVVPEIPTLTMEGGGMIIMEGLSKDKISQFQSLLMKAVINLEDYFYDLAVLSGKESVIFYDRGVMDPKGYMDQETWQAVLDESNWNEVYLRDKRYDAVIHMVTAADGAQKFYTLENNQARYEDADTAIKVDMNLHKAWNGHPHQIVIDNSAPSFDLKIKRVINAVEKFIGIPQTSDFLKKYLVQDFQIPNEFNQSKFEVEEIFLETDPVNEQEYIRKRGANGAYSYAHTIRIKDQEHKQTRLIKSHISAREYMNMLQRKNKNLEILKKDRTCFIYERQSFIIEKIVNDPEQTTILRIENTNAGNEIKFPPFVKIQKEVTGDPNYTSYNIAKKIKK